MAAKTTWSCKQLQSMNLLLIILFGALSCSMVCGQMDNTVELMACDNRPNKEDLYVYYCPNLNYTVIVECHVKGYLLAWKSGYFSTATFSPENEVFDYITKGYFTFILVDRVEVDSDTSNYASQLRVHTSALTELYNSNDDALNVNCTASTEVQSMVFIKISGGVQPVIDDVNTAANQLIVSWLSNNSEIVNATASLERGDVSIPSSCLDLIKKEAVFDMDPTVSYNITVIEYNKCEQNFSSEPFSFFPNLSPSPSVPVTTPVCSCVAESPTQGDSNEGSASSAVIAMGLFLHLWFVQL